jgi:PIF1-like helicase/Helitron helicase-like domain at N-terminus
VGPENQTKIRADTYKGLTDALAVDPQMDANNLGQRIILPSSFSGSSRFMIQNCQDALAINCHFKGADFFLTMTANPNWPEIKAALLPGQSSADRPDLVNRVFHLKVKELMDDIYKQGVLGRAVAHVWTTEFQKRGLPHVHLIIFLHPDSKLSTPEEIDSLLSAEFPDEDEDPELLELVKTFMVHTPCGPHRPNAPCMHNGKCSKSFPKPFRDHTTVNEDSYANLRRRDTDKKYQVRGEEVDNRSVVAYPPYWLWKYRCHINMECLFSVRCFKYIYKYVYKGHDCTTMEFGRCEDEVKLYLDSRYVSGCEAIWRLYHFPMHEEFPKIVRLQVHLPQQQIITWNAETVANLQDVVEEQAEKDTNLTAYFKANANHPEARDLLYQDMPSKFVWIPKQRKWKPRQQGFALGRMYYAHPNSGERFYLRTLLTSVKGATSFEDLRHVNGVLHPTFHAACLAYGLLEDDNEWRQCLQEAAHMATGYQLRNLFVTLLRDCSPSDPLALWMEFRINICDDLRHALHSKNIILDPTEEQVFDYGLYLIDCLLRNSNKSLQDWPAMPLPQHNWAVLAGNRLIAEQHDYDNDQETGLANQLIPTLNNGQLAAFNAIVNAVETKSGQTFFLHGPGGTGKTYVYNTLCHFLRGQGKIVICVASSGIASLLLMGGRTSHSTFKIPIEIHEGSTCSIGKHSDLAGLIRAADLVIWDEAPMQHRHIHEAVDRTFKDIRHCEDKPFGGLTVVFGGDFKQILPVIVKGSRPEIVGACIQRSRLWGCVKVLKLTENMHVNTHVEAEKHFAKWQLDVGHGKFTDELGSITLPNHFKCTENTIASLIQTIYPGINQLPLPPDQYFAERTILTSRNDDVDDINEGILKQFPGEEREFLSADSVKNNGEDGNDDLLYPVEYLNSINCSGLPLAKLKLKVGCPVMILRNLNPGEGVCNGSRGIVTRMSNRVLEVRLLTGSHAGTTTFIPRLSITPSSTQVPFEFCQRQFPVRVCFAMSINKSQGQSVKHVGLDVRNAVFTHGQLYVAVSRVTSVFNLKVIWDSNVALPITKNIVYPEVLID